MKQDIYISSSAILSNIFLIPVAFLTNDIMYVTHSSRYSDKYYKRFVTVVYIGNWRWLAGCPFPTERTGAGKYIPCARCCWDAWTLRRWLTAHNSIEWITRGCIHLASDNYHASNINAMTYNHDDSSVQCYRSNIAMRGFVAVSLSDRCCVCTARRIELTWASLVCPTRSRDPMDGAFTVGHKHYSWIRWITRDATVSSLMMRCKVAAAGVYRVLPSRTIIYILCIDCL